VLLGLTLNKEKEHSSETMVTNDKTVDTSSHHTEQDYTDVQNPVTSMPCSHLTNLQPLHHTAVTTQSCTNFSLFCGCFIVLLFALHGPIFVHNSTIHEKILTHRQ